MGSENYHEALQEVFRQKGSAGVRTFLLQAQEAFSKDIKALTVDKIAGFARTAGCDMKQFALAMRTRRHLALVRSTMKRARKVGVMGTPSVYINGKYVRGRSVHLYRRHINRALKEAQSTIGEKSGVTARTYYRYLMKHATPSAVWLKQAKK